MMGVDYEASPRQGAPSQRSARPLPHQSDGSRRGGVGRTRVKDVTITHLWEPNPYPGMRGSLRFPLLISAGPWEKGVPGPSLYHLEE